MVDPSVERRGWTPRPVGRGRKRKTSVRNLISFPVAFITRAMLESPNDPLRGDAAKSSLHRSIAIIAAQAERIRDAIRSAAKVASAKIKDPMRPDWGRSFYLNDEIVTHLRYALHEAGWRPRDEHRFATTVDPTGTVAILVKGGSRETGDPNPNARPSLRCGVGFATHVATHQNAEQLHLPFESAVPQHSTVDAAVERTWVLLILLDETEVRFEISLPDSIAEGQVEVDWLYRGFQDRVDFAEPRRIDSDDKHDEGGDFVSKKNSG